MKLLLDTHIVLAIINDTVSALPKDIASLLSAPENTMTCSVASQWEIAIKSRLGKLMDVYHDVVIVPVVIYFAVTLLPVIYLSGTTLEQNFTSLVIVVWLACVFGDIKCDRMNQRRLLERLGLRFPD